MNLPFSAQQLKQHVDQDLATCQSLLALLKQEQEALKKRDADTVEKVIEQKMPLLEILENSAKLRQAWALTANQDANEAGWAAMITELADSALKSNWQALKESYLAVREQNEINGKLLSRHQKTITRLLDLMRGKTGGPSLYNATGYSSSQAQSHKFGEA